MGGLAEKPKLRWPLDIQYIEAQGRRFVTLRDPLGVASEPLVFPVELMAIVSRFDGVNSLSDILLEGAPYGLTEELLREVLKDLDELSYLENDKTKQACRRIRDEYAASDVRIAAHAGRVYPAEPQALSKAIEDYVEQSDSSAVPKDFNSLFGIMSPHIDYQRGWRTYGTAFRALMQSESPDVIFMLGTSHQGSEGLFHLTRKHFETPLGRVESAREVITDIARRYGAARLFSEEMLHRTEHSLELQLPFLQHCYRNGKKPRLVPILVGSFYQYFEGNREPIEDAAVLDFVEALAECARALTDSGQKVLFYGGVDLAHMGQFFGDATRLTEADREHIAARDQILLQSMTAADETAIFSHMAEDKDLRRICGYPSMYTMIAAMKRSGGSLRGRTFEYRQAYDSQSDCLVSFASAGWVRA